MRTDWFVQTDRGRMLGDYLATAVAGGAAVSVYLAAAPPDPGVREGVYAARTPLAR
jgi:hypothetical protein